MRAWGLWAVLTLAGVGCAPKVVSGGIEVYESIWERTDRDLRYRAAMELRCSHDIVRLTLVQRQGKFPVLVHAEGCGAQALYSRQLRRHHGQYTDKNSDWTVESKSAAEQPALSQYP